MTVGLGEHGVDRRHCSRPGCSERAAITLSYEYARSQVWLDDLRPQRDPHDYDLCVRHGDRLSVPNGWMLKDRRRVAASLDGSALEQPRLIAV